MAVRFAPFLTLLLATSGLTAQEPGPWKGWTTSTEDAPKIRTEGDSTRVRLPAGTESYLSWNGRFGDGRIEVQWRASEGTALWLTLREHQKTRGHRLLLTPAQPTGAIVGPRGERSDTDKTAWHRAVIRAQGASIDLDIDGGKVAAQALDPRLLEGQVRLEIHRSAGSGPGFLDLREPVIESPGTHSWETVLDGTKPIDGDRWERVPGGTWTVEDGAVVGACQKSEPRHGILLSRFEVDDFSARIVYRAVKGNSGFYFRCDKVAGALGVHGFQAEIDATRDAGMLYETGGRARVQVPSKARVQKAFRPGEWNQMLVTAKGRRVEVYVNGYRMTQLIDDPGRLRGRLGLQLHGGQDMRVEVRSVELLQPALEKRVR